MNKTKTTVHLFKQYSRHDKNSPSKRQRASFATYLFAWHFNKRLLSGWFQGCCQRVTCTAAADVRHCDEHKEDVVRRYNVAIVGLFKLLHIVSCSHTHKLEVNEGGMQSVITFEISSQSYN